MAKRPRAGASKTRLVPELSADAAAELSECMLRDSVARLLARTDCTVLLAVDPPESREWFSNEFPGIGIVEQRGAALGDRLDAALSDVLGDGFDAAFAIGSDSPDLPDEHLTSAFERLDDPGVDVVLGPTADGGYYLIGWTKPWSTLVTDVQMSTSTVLSDTLEIAERIGARVALAPTWHDVDVPSDLRRLRDSLDVPGLSQTAEFFASSYQSRPRVIVVVPALNEAENIDVVVRSLLETEATMVVVADNGSTDDTAEIARLAGAVVTHESRRGYGYACAAGSLVALERGADVVAYTDADGSSRASELASIVKPLAEERAVLVLGSRTRGAIADGAMPRHQLAGNRAISALMRWLYRVDVTDLGPYRAINAEALRSLDMQEMTFGWPTEMMVKVAARGDAILEVPVSWDRRLAGESKVGGTLKGSVLAAYDIIRVIIRHAGRRRTR